MEKENIIKSKSFQLALDIIELYKTLVAKNEYVMSKQILKSGTSIGANVTESNGAISDADFSNKISIAYKEALETKYWLELLYKSDYIDKTRYTRLINNTDEICRILFSILKKTRINKPVN